MSEEALREQPLDQQAATPRAKQHRSKRGEVNGWVVLDKPVGVTSTHAVSRLKRIYNGKKAGHAGTLDPLASGILPIAFGEATKTVPYVQDGEKGYRFTVLWGAETDTDDADGRIVAQSERRPARAEVEACCPASPARSSKRRPPTRPSRSPASAPTTSPAPARR